MTPQSGPDRSESGRIQPGEIIRLFDQSQAFMAYMRGPEYHFDYVNAAFVAIVGGRDVTGKPLAEALPDVAGVYVPMLDEVVRSAKPMRVTGDRYDRQLEPGGPVTEHYTDFVYQPILDDQGRVEGVLLQGTDVTERVLAERAVTEAQNAAAAAEFIKAEFVSQLNHDVRAPMSAVMSLIDILAATQPLTPEQQEYLRILRMSADSVVTQVGDMVDSARIESRNITLQSQPFSPVGVLRDAVNALTVPARDKGLDIEIRAELSDEARFTGDPGRIRQVLTLLCAHALRTTEAGRIGLRVYKEEGDGLVFKVTDTGPGLSPEALATLFERTGNKAFERRYHGNGVGLPMSRILAEMMGGSVSAESAPDEGTTFTLRLPVAVAEGDDSVDDASDAPVVEHEGLAPILVVEDYEPNVLIMTTYLNQMGYSLEVARNGHAAVTKAAGGTYALVLMDVQMPGLTGLEATRIIREKEAESGARHLPIVGVTAHSLAVDRQRCLDAGMDDFLPKPFGAADLQEKILSILAEYGV